jgi:hypothetical protein
MTWLVNYCNNNSYYNNLPIGKPINKFQVNIITFEKQRKRKRKREGKELN